MEKEPKVFANGMMFKVRENQPSFIVGSLSIKSEDFVNFLSQHTGESGWCNLDIKQSSNGKFYVELNTWKAKSSNEPAPNLYNNEVDSKVIAF